MKQTRKTFLRLLGLTSAGVVLGGVKAGAYSLNSIIKPAQLKQGDTIGLVSPAGILPDPDQYDEIDQTIRSMGFNVVAGPNSRKRHGYFAGTDRERADDFNAMFADPDIQAIIPYRGGWGSSRILEYIDFDQIKKNPKILLGFSDITTLLLAIYSKTGLITFHGPVGKSEWTDITKNHFKTAIMGNKPFTLANSSKSECEHCPGISTITPGRATGTLAGGNMTVISSMIGTGYLPDWNGKILFLEDVGEDFYRIDRMLTQMKMNGILDSINAFIFGVCQDCRKGSYYSFSLEQILSNHVKPLGIPAFYGSMFGHIDNMFTLPVGIQAKIDAEAGTIGISESPTR